MKIIFKWKVYKRVYLFIKLKIALKTIKLALSLILKAKQNAILLVILITKKDIYLKIKGT